jgi:tRNA modification GTPase
LLDTCAELEAGLDFVEEDIEFISAVQLQHQLAEAINLVQGTLDQVIARGEIADEPRIVLRGWPNVGKSALWNALVHDRRAMVANQPGTTRDYLVGRLDLDGVLAQLVDTAGTQPSQHELDRAAQKMADGQQARADVLVLCFDATRKLNPWERQELRRTTPQDQRLLVLTKVDQPCHSDLEAAAIRTSSRDGQGIEQLRAQLRGMLEARSHAEAGVVASTAARCGESLRSCLESLGRARDLSTVEAGDELVAFELRCALDALGQVVGAVYTDDILERIFSRFCIGK